MSNANFELADRLQERFEFYLLALVFTTLGAAINTAHLGHNSLSDGFELLSWSCLGFAGMIGVKRLEWVPVIHKYGGRLDQIAEQDSKLNTALNSGETQMIGSHGAFVRISDQLDANSTKRKAYAEKQKEVSEKIKPLYARQKTLFGLGLLSLGLARSFPALAKIGPDILELLRNLSAA